MTFRTWGFRAAKPRYARCFFTRPLLGRVSTWFLRLRALAEHGPDSLLSRTPTSTHVPTCSLYAALDAAVLVAAIETGADMDAFGTGIQIAIFVALIGIGLFGVLGWIIKQLGRSV